MRFLPAAPLFASLLLLPALAAAQTPPAAPPSAPYTYPYYAGPYAPPAQRMAPMPPPHTHMVRHSGALMGGGIALTALGVLSGFAAMSAFIEDGRNNYRGAMAGIIGIPALIHMVGCLAGGIPMIVIGNRKIPIEIPVMIGASRGVSGMGWRF